MISLYRILTFFLFPILILLTYLRRFTNKEHSKRYKEKIFFNENFYPKNNRIFWIHAASIGEANSVIPLIQELTKNDKQIFILFTSTTLSSSKLIEKKILGLKNVKHRFFPLDINFLVKKFLNHWKPELIIFVDSEVWPNYLLEINKRQTPLILLNGRITMKTFRRWRLFPALSKKLFNIYDLCLSSSYESERNLKLLGAKNVKFFGNLKFCSSLTNENKNKDLKILFKNFHIWCAASTHPGEEEIILKTHNLLKQKGINILTIIIPRHIIRSKEIYEICNNLKLRSKIVEKNSTISNEAEILIINSIGEMTKYFYNCKSIFMGKSFSRKLIRVGGQNPIEPAKCGCKIYHGPYVSNFHEIYRFLNEKKIAFKINSEIELADNLLKDFHSKSVSSEKNIDELNDYGKKILTLTTQAVLKLNNDI
ncbi:hypothetical protein OA496_00615 [Pelagibacteraceae bacterium]|nr:hypothetical protein [Pelagibacteraceae bacterium]